eukprot:TRINITY_DN74921_c0_g1_i1.p2 TRINITY_DN74921_c0_g1~~TRINITY_DN74921_c0_g1_i1.p2  ORF type:complete len:241 (+),score=57.55 TRINITY_DN74921_c0_g1_i1:84-806(+)
MPPKRPTLDKRTDLPKILSMAWLWSSISGAVNLVTLKELAAPTGYTSGHAVNVGRALAAQDGTFQKIFAITVMYLTGGVITGVAPGICDGDAVFEGRTSIGMIISSFLLLLGTWAKKQNQPLMAVQLFGLSQGLMNGISSAFSAAPIRTTHVAGGQTDACIILGKSARALSRGDAVPPLRKVYLNFTGTFGMACGGFLAEKLYKKLGLKTILIPAGALLASATILPAIMPATPEEEEKAA